MAREKCPCYIHKDTTITAKRSLSYMEVVLTRRKGVCESKKKEEKVKIRSQLRNMEEQYRNKIAINVKF